MHCQSFRVSIREASFKCNKVKPEFRMPDSAVDEVNSSWLLVYPGLGLDQVRDFTLRTTTSDWPDFWACANSAFAFLCSRRLLPDSPLKKFRIVLTDMFNSFGWYLLWRWGHTDQDGPIMAALEDYEKGPQSVCGSCCRDSAMRRLLALTNRTSCGKGTYLGRMGREARGPCFLRPVPTPDTTDLCLFNEAEGLRLS